MKKAGVFSDWRECARDSWYCHVCIVYCASCHKPKVVDEPFQGKVQCGTGSEYGGKPVPGRVYVFAASERVIAVKVCAERNLLDYVAVMVFVAEIAYWVQSGLFFLERRKMVM
ncbi:MAG: hypothetical protein IJ794_00805 [Lachnospiraceae bacterium]|nr:hypothetical protein [Lachnospiraceae bacterium]